MSEKDIGEEIEFMTFGPSRGIDWKSFETPLEELPIPDDSINSDWKAYWVGEFKINGDPPNPEDEIILDDNGEVIAPHGLVEHIKRIRNNER